MPIASIIISSLALVVSGVTMWVTLLRRGALRMTQPTLVFFGPDGQSTDPKVYLRTLLYSTARRGQIIENMFVKLRRGETSQNFNIWVYGDGPLARGSGLLVSETGVTCNHHFLLPKDGTHFEFLTGEYVVETYASMVGRPTPLLLNKIRVTITEQQADELRNQSTGIFFDWGPDSKVYYSHIDQRPNRAY